VLRGHLQRPESMIINEDEGNFDITSILIVTNLFRNSPKKSTLKFHFRRFGKDDAKDDQGIAGYFEE